MGEAPWLAQGFKLVHLALYEAQEICPGRAQDLSEQQGGVFWPVSQSWSPWEGSAITR